MTSLRTIDRGRNNDLGRATARDTSHVGRERTVSPSSMWDVTPQQWRIFLLMGKALSNKAIAYEMGVMESTVKAHVGAIFKASGCRNRTEVALLSLRLRYGLMEEDHDASKAFAAYLGADLK